MSEDWKKNDSTKESNARLKKRKATSTPVMHTCQSASSNVYIRNVDVEGCECFPMDARFSKWLRAPFLYKTTANSKNKNVIRTAAP